MTFKSRYPDLGRGKLLQHPSVINKLQDDVEALSRPMPGVGTTARLTSSGLQINSTAKSRFNARITGKDSSMPPKYSFQQVMPDSGADGNYVDDTNGRQGSATSWPAYERTGNLDVPTDGTIIVEMVQGGGEFYEFSFGSGEGVDAGIFAKINTAVSGTAYGWIQQTPMPAGTWADTVNGESGTTTNDPAYEFNLSTTVALNSIVRLYRGEGDTIVEFTGGGGTGATGTVQISGGAVTGITVTNGGTHYTSAPTVTIINETGGTGAMAQANVANGVVQSVTITAGGTGYQPQDRRFTVGGGGGGDTVVRLTTGTPTGGLYTAIVQNKANTYPNPFSDSSTNCYWYEANNAGQLNTTPTAYRSGTAIGTSGGLTVYSSDDFNLIVKDNKTGASVSQINQLQFDSPGSTISDDWTISAGAAARQEKIAHNGLTITVQYCDTDGTIHSLKFENGLLKQRV